MKKLTQEQAIVVSGYTGVLICDFGDLHGDIEKRLGRPVWTGEMPSIEDEIKGAYKDDFLALFPEKDQAEFEVNGGFIGSNVE